MIYPLAIGGACIITSIIGTWFVKLGKNNILISHVHITGNSTIGDNNVFYPEGGGQPGDIGVIKCGNKTYEVVNTKYVDKKIVLCVEGSKSFNLNQELLCNINWERRFKIMQVHTCLHLLCSIIKAAFSIDLLIFFVNSKPFIGFEKETLFPFNN